MPWWTWATLIFFVLVVAASAAVTVLSLLRMRRLNATGDRVAAALDDGKLKPVIDSVFPLSEAAAAQERMRENKHFGKIVLKV